MSKTPTTPSALVSNGHKDTKPIINPAFNLSAISKDLKCKGENITSFPLDVFPNKVQDIINQKVQGLSFHPDYSAGAHFIAAATAIGATTKSKFCGYDVTANLQISLVGDPGVNKSEPAKDALKPFEEKDDDNWREYEKEMEQHEINQAKYTKKEIAEKPKQPILKKSIVTDTTLEALAQVCANNRRGCCSFVDEDAGRLKNMNRYNNGSDQEAYLSLFNCTSFNIDRATKKSIRVVSPCVSTFGTIQPAVLDEFAKDNRGANGFRDRILFIWPNDLKRPVWSRKKIDELVRIEWFRIINKLIEGLNFSISNDKEVPTYILFTTNAEDALVEWQKQSVANDEEIEDNERFGISAKIYIYVLRFALIIQLLRWACGEADKNFIDDESARRAIKLAEYFRSQALKVAKYISSRNPIEHLPKNKEELYLLLPEKFTTAQAKLINNSLSEGIKLPDRTLEHWLTDNHYFSKLKHGNYQKKY